MCESLAPPLDKLGKSPLKWAGPRNAGVELSDRGGAPRQGRG